VWDVFAAADQQRVTLLLALLDLSAVFDCVDHDVLLSCLECTFRLCGWVLGWIRSYLSEHTHSDDISLLVSSCLTTVGCVTRFRARSTGLSAVYCQTLWRHTSSRSDITLLCRWWATALSAAWGSPHFARKWIWKERQMKGKWSFLAKCGICKEWNLQVKVTFNVVNIC